MEDKKEIQIDLRAYVGDLNITIKSLQMIISEQRKHIDQLEKVLKTFERGE